MVENRSSSHSDNLKNDFLILGGDTFGINGSFGAPEKKLILILVKQRQNLYLINLNALIQYKYF